MNMVLCGLIGVGVIGIVYCFYMLYRNNKVYKLRMEMIDFVFDQKRYPKYYSLYADDPRFSYDTMMSLKHSFTPVGRFRKAFFEEVAERQ